ncbi:MAG: YdcF family protein [Acetobacterium woodii]|nr:YdcF family protein [Acetobacterium woodii]
MVDIIVVLGGGIYHVGGLRKDPEASGTTYSRLFSGVKIFQKSNAKFLVLSGKSESEVMRDLALKIGIPEDRIIIESRSNNTMEHAIELRRLFPQARRMRIGVVTSALHMPRAIRSFKKIFVEDTILPIPVGYTYSLPEYNIRSIIPSAEELSTSSYVIHEWIGMIWYKAIMKSMQAA